MLSQTIEFTAPTAPAQDFTRYAQGVIYINALAMIADQSKRYQYGAIHLGVLMQNSESGEEFLIDLLTPCDRFSTVLKILRLHFPDRRWSFVESWVIEETAVPLAA